MNDDTRFTEVDAAVDAVQRATPDSPSAEAVTRAPQAEDVPAEFICSHLIHGVRDEKEK